MKHFIKRLAGRFGYEITKAHSKEDGFAVSGISYEVNACSVGKTPEGEQAAEGAIRMIKERNLQNLKILDLGCGVGIIGLTIFTRLNKEVTEMAFSDINIFNLQSVERTIKLNNLQNHFGTRLNCYLSDGLKHIPASEKFDIIICNPPHFHGADSASDWLSPSKLGSYDANWNFHKSFYEQCANLLSKTGEVWMFENAESDAGNFMPYIKANGNLKYVNQFPEPLNPRFYWMISQRVEK